MKVKQHGLVPQVLVCLSVACAPQWDDALCDSANVGGTLAVTVEPPAPLDQVAPVFRVHVAGDLDPTDVHVIRGELTSNQLGQLVRDDVSMALAERLVPVVRWSDGATAVLAPGEVFAAGETVTVATVKPRAARELTISEETNVAVLPRVWPPLGGSASNDVAVWCAAEPVATAPMQIAVELAPEGHGVVRSGAAASLAGRGCVRLEATLNDGPAVVPPRLDSGLVLDPRPLARDIDPPHIEARLCGDGERKFADGCARVMDDRVIVAPPAWPVLWTVAGDELDQVVTSTSSSDLFVIASLKPSAPFAWQFEAMDAAGRVTGGVFAGVTEPAMAHVVINEVYANPIGVEPDQEWVELYNDGQLTALLDQYALIDIGGVTALPAASLDPGEYALVVNASFDEGNQYDAAPAPGTTLLWVAKLGKGGLNNQGEPLELHHASSGEVVSRFGPEPKPKAGHSVMRVQPSAPDESPASFARTATPTPGAANALE